MKWFSTALCCSFFWVLALAVAPAGASDDAAAIGKETFLAQKCNLCHSIAGAEITRTTKVEKLAGPDLDGVGDRHDKEWMVAYIQRKEKGESGKLHTKPFKGTDEELQAIVDWLGTLTEASP